MGNWTGGWAFTGVRHENDRYGLIMSIAIWDGVSLWRFPCLRDVSIRILYSSHEGKSHDYYGATAVGASNNIAYSSIAMVCPMRKCIHIALVRYSFIQRL
jgi:hypothetical protein